MQKSGPNPSGSLLRGTVYMDAERRSMIGHIWRVVASVIIRESGF